jgi:outer membrane protein assembly factor BamE
MKPIDRISALRLTLAILVSLAAASVLPGCVYRPDIQQGNLLQTTDVDQVKVGMTRSQVRYILGTPMVSDPFDQQRWDYVYTFRRGRDRDVLRAHFIVRFQDDKVSSVEKPDLPEETANTKIIQQQRERQAASAAAVAEAAAAAAPPAPAAATPPAPAAPDGDAVPPAAGSTDAPPADRPPGG